MLIKIKNVMTNTYRLNGKVTRLDIQHYLRDLCNIITAIVTCSTTFVCILQQNQDSHCNHKNVLTNIIEGKITKRFVLLFVLDSIKESRVSV
jgi:hypothetical protein